MRTSSVVQEKATMNGHKDALSVLVVDDDPTFCLVVREIMRMLGFEVHLAFSVDDAIEFLEIKTPDLILTDIMMPEIDGITLIRRLRAQPEWSTIPTVAISARPRKEIAYQVQDAGADAHLDKPFSINELRSTIATFFPNGQTYVQ